MGLLGPLPLAAWVPLFHRQCDLQALAPWLRPKTPGMAPFLAAPNILADVAISRLSRPHRSAVLKREGRSRGESRAIDTCLAGNCRSPVSWRSRRWNRPGQDRRKVGSRKVDRRENHTTRIHSNGCWRQPLRSRSGSCRGRSGREDDRQPARCLRYPASHPGFARPQADRSRCYPKRC